MITIYGDEIIEGARRLHHPIELKGINCSVKKIFINRSIDEIIPTGIVIILQLFYYFKLHIFMI